MRTTEKLRRVDLNLLVSFHVLFEERSVTRAAERMFITQPAMSKTLGRMRELLGDPLFVLSGRRLVPTPRAEQLAAGLGPWLQETEGLLAGDTFDPATHEARWTIAAMEAIAQRIYPPLLARIQEAAPGIAIRAVTPAGDVPALLVRGEVDISVGLAGAWPPEITTVSAGSGRVACVMRAEHPLAGKPLDLDAFCAYPHVRYFVPGLTPGDVALIDQRLAEYGRTRRTCFETMDLESAYRVVAETDSLFCGPANVAASGGEPDRFVATTLPREIELEEAELVLAYHQRMEADPAHRWLRGELAAALRSLRAGRDSEK